MSYNDLLKQTRSIANSFVAGDNTSWQPVLEQILFNMVKAGVEEGETTFESLVKAVQDTAHQSVAPAVEENIWDILSEHETFDEQAWQSVSDRFQIALDTYLTQNAENIADSVIDEVVDDVQYNKSKTRFFGHSEDDFQ